MQLVFPGFLWGLMALAVPVVIHLLQLRRPRRLQFTNTGFIQEMGLKTGRQRLQNLLVLALRMLAVIALVLAFCQPFLPARSAGEMRGQLVQMLVDTSPSMQAPAETAGDLKMEAVTVAGRLAEEYDRNTRVRLLGYQKAALVRSSLRAALADYSQQKRPVGWGARTAWQPEEAPSRGPVYVLSDFQKSEVGAEAFAHLPAKQEVVLVPQVAKPVGNAYVDSVWLNDAFVRAKANVALHIRLRNGGKEEVTDCPVKVLLGGRQVAAFQVTLMAGQAVEKTAQLQLPGERNEQGQVVTGDAPVTFDNTYYFMLRPATALQVVEIGPAPVTQAAYQNEPLFRYSFARPQQVDFSKLQQANLVLLSGPTEIGVGLQAALAGVVQRGGSVVIAPTANAGGPVRGAYNQLLQALGAGTAQWENAAASQPVLQELAMPDLRSSFFREVFGAQSRQVVLPAVSPVWRAVGGGTDILRLRDGTGFLTEFARSAGRVYVFSAPFDKRYSDFTGHALFVPVLYRLAMLSYRDDQPLAYRVGQAVVSLRVLSRPSANADEATYRLVHESSALVPAQRVLGQRLLLQIPPELTAPGFYQVQRQEKSIATLAFNGAKDESELAAYSVADLRQLAKATRPNVRVLDADKQPAALHRYRAGQTDQPLWRYCLLLALGCLLAEEAVLRWSRRARVLRPAGSGRS